MNSISKRQRSTLASAPPLSLASSLLLATQTLAAPNPDLSAPAEFNSEVLEQIESYSSEDPALSLEQNVQGASKFRDVRPTDWAFQALDDLIKRYDCLVGYPDGTFRGDRALTRYEFAAGLNACSNQIERLIASATGDLAKREDLETLRRLTQEFETELAALGTRVDNLEARTAILEDHQFSTTTKLKGSAAFILADTFTDLDQRFDTDFNRQINSRDRIPGGGNTTLSSRASLSLTTSFTGKDSLRISLGGRNYGAFRWGNVTNEGRLGIEAGSRDIPGNVTLGGLYYRFPMFNDRANMIIGVNGTNVDESVTHLNTVLSPLNPFQSSGTGALSRWGRANPIYSAGGQGAGLGFQYKVAPWLEAGVAYTARQANLTGLFNGNYAVAGQVILKPFERLKVGLTYVHGYRDGGVGWSVGSLASSFRVSNPAASSSNPVPVVSNNYSIEANFDITDKIFVGGWLGYTAARAIESGDGDMFYWNSYIGIEDFGLPKSRLGLMFGMEPRLMGSSPKIGRLLVAGLGNRLNNRADDDTSYHVEGFYTVRLNRHIAITPGFIWLTAPGMQNVNPDIWIGVLRTSFSF